MLPNIKFYKILILKDFLQTCQQARDQLLNELTINATDPTLYRRRFRMIAQLGQYENQIVKKIQDFDTDNIDDLIYANLHVGIAAILNRNA